MIGPFISLIVQMVIWAVRLSLALLRVMIVAAVALAIAIAIAGVVEARRAHRAVR